MKPQRIQLSRRKGFNLQAASQALNGLPAVKCARPGKWGNPFKVGEPPPKIYMHMEFDNSDTFRYMDQEVVKDAAEAVRLHWMYALPNKKDIESLRGKNLACWCKEGEPCHALILLEIANR